MTDQAIKPKHLLIVNQSAPYSSNARESLDLALATASFEQNISVLFQGDGCYQLLPDQASTSIEHKSITKMLKAFPVYGIEELLVDTQGLEERNIEKLEEGLNVRKISASEIKALYRNASTVIRF